LNPAVVVISQAENRLKAVELVRRPTGFELVWSKSRRGGHSELAGFAAECGLAGNSPTEAVADGRTTVTGFDSAGVVFYRISVPAAKKDELSAMVKLQAESRLPLPVQKMEVAWRAGEVRDGQVPVTIAGAKTEQLQKYLEDVRAIRPARILLDCEGVVKVWRAFFSGNDLPAVVVSIGQRNTRVCLAENGRMTNVVSLDVGMNDFDFAEQPIFQSDVGERFAQDMRSVLELFGYRDPGAVPVFVLSDGSVLLGDVVQCLASSGLRASVALPELEKLTVVGGPGAEDVYEYRVPIGLALAVLDGDAETLDVFERLYTAARARAARAWFYSLKAAVTFTIVVVVLAAGAFFAADVISERRLGKLTETAEFKELLQRRELIRMVARQRPDLIDLLGEINSIEGEGVMLDTFRFAKGQPVSISGQADNAEQLYNFHEALVGKAGLGEVKMTSGKEPKGDKLNFTITFHYKNFTRKKIG
jgi:hypothetical protein